jgi:tetratricopeptide (TPR) repeat protein
MQISPYFNPGSFYQPGPSYPLAIPLMGSPYPAVQSSTFYPPSQPISDPTTPNTLQAEAFKNMGDDLRKKRLYGKAIEAYQSAINTNPQYTDAYFNFAQLMVVMGNYPAAIKLLTDLLIVNPNDHDARVTLGDYDLKMGNSQEAKKRYMEVLNVQPNFDPAKRKLEYLLYRDQKLFPDTSNELLQIRYKEVVFPARRLLHQYFTKYHPNPVLLKLSQTVPIVFEETQEMDGSANIAENDAQRGVIRLKPEMLFSTHNVVAAYLAHELIHTLNENSETSIMEEQDGYRESARFWSSYRNAEKEPNLDLALKLYRKSPDALDQEVRRVYTIRDPDIPEKTPGHGLPPKTPLMKAYLAYEARAKLSAQDKAEDTAYDKAKNS